MAWTRQREAPRRVGYVACDDQKTPVIAGEHEILPRADPQLRSGKIDHAACARLTAVDRGPVIVS